MKVLFLIAARGGSKSIPGKNLARIAGLPLLGYKAIAAKRSAHCSRLVLSSDDPDIQACARDFGMEVPFKRPAELATDAASSESVLAHAMTFFEENGEGDFDAVLLLEPTTPFARHEDFDAAVALMEEQSADLVVGMCPHKLHPAFIGPMNKEGDIGSIVEQFASSERRDRQYFVPQFTMNGAFYLARWDYFMQHRRLYRAEGRNYGVVMSPYDSIEIDEPIDLDWAKFLVESGKVDVSYWKQSYS